MSVVIQEAKSINDLKTFVNLPFEIYKNNKYWIPSLKKDEVKALMPQHNPAFKYCDVKFWIAMEDGKCVGRIGGIINREHNKKTGENMTRFTRAEYIDNEQVSSLLFKTVEQWGREMGMEGIHGPLGFTNLDHQAMLIEGFDYLPSIASEYHLPYYKSHVEKAGYEKELDWIEFRLTIGEIPEKAQKLNEIIKRRYGLKVLRFTKSSQMKPYGKEVFRVLNKAFGDLFSMVELNEEMIEYYTNRYFSFLNPKFVKIVLNKDDGLVGFIIGMPSLSRAMQKANGKLFPFGFIHIMRALKNPDVVDLMLTGIDPDLQGQGVSALLITELQQTMIDHDVGFVETTGIIETNHKAIQHWKNYEHIQHKRKRCFKKELK